MAIRISIKTQPAAEQPTTSAPTLAGDPDKPETCPEHVYNPQTQACVRCLMPMRDHPMAGGQPPAKPKILIKINGETKPLVVPPPQTLMQALSAPKPEEPPPWEQPENYTILDALKEHFSRSQKGETLQLIAVKNGGNSWTVKSYSHETGRAVLEHSMDKMVIRPVITEREIPLYTPFWR